MSVQAVLLPVFVYVALCYATLGGMIVTKGDSRFGAHFRNLYEMPVLFLALVAFALITRRTDTLFVVLEWLYVALRLVHAAIHVTRNTQPARGAAFAASAAVLGLAWIVFAVGVLFA